MFSLYILGGLIEPVVGRLRFALVYFVSLLAGSFGALLLTPAGRTVGASGAIFGLMGATFIVLRNRGINPMESGLGLWLGLNLAITFLIRGSPSAATSAGSRRSARRGGPLRASLPSPRPSAGAGAGAGRGPRSPGRDRLDSGLDGTRGRLTGSCRGPAGQRAASSWISSERPGGGAGTKSGWSRVAEQLDPVDEAGARP
jgi:hypothetical protein